VVEADPALKLRESIEDAFAAFLDATTVTGNRP
jgi:hypothetical protein